MSPPEPTPRPMVGLPVAAAAGGAPAPPRHETVLSAEPDEALRAVDTAVAIDDEPERGRALTRAVGEHPALLEGWARLSELHLARGDAVVAYGCARVAYHRGLDRLRREGWGGTGIVRWAQPSNRGFLRGLRALLAAAAALGELDESTRCREFLLELDPDDGLGAATYPAAPGPGWTPPPIA